MTSSEFEYQSIPLLDRPELEGLLQSTDPVRIVYGLLSAALYDFDLAWAEDQCIRRLYYPNLDVQNAALTSIGHIARLNGAINLPVVVPILIDLLKNPDTAGLADDALDMIETHVDRELKRPHLGDQSDG